MKFFRSLLINRMILNIVITINLSFILICKVSSQVRWQPLISNVKDSKAAYPIKSLALDNDNNVVYASIDKEVFRWKGQGYYWENILSTGLFFANGEISIIHVDKFRNVYATGMFTNSAGRYYVAKSSWNPLTQKNNPWVEIGNLNPSGPIYAITSDIQGNIYAAGSFLSPTGYRYVAKWNGTTWSELGTGANALNANSPINALCVDSVGNVYSGGGFTNSAGRVYVAKWNGNNWIEFGSNNVDQSVGSSLFPRILSLATDGIGNIYAAGSIRNASNIFCVRKSNGGNWSEVGQGAYGSVVFSEINSLSLGQNGSVYASNCFTNVSGGAIYSPAKWNGAIWSRVGNTASLNLEQLITSTVFNKTTGRLFASGGIKNNNNQYYVANHNTVSNDWEETAPIGSGNVNSPGKLRSRQNSDTVYAKEYNYVNTWDLVSWKKTTQPADHSAYNLVVDKQNNLFADFKNFASKAFIAKLVGTNWVNLGNSQTVLNADDFTQIEIDSSGNLYTIGSFVNSAGRYYVAKWDGANWSEVGAGPNSLNCIDKIRYIHIDKFNNLYAIAPSVYTYYVFKWNGQSWTKFPNPISGPSEIGGYITTDTSGALYGSFSFFGSSYIRKWTGAEWQLLQQCQNIFLFDKFNNLFQHPDQNFERVKRWGGDAWYPVITDTAEKFKDKTSLYSDYKGNLIAIGTLNDTNTVAKIDCKFLRLPFITKVSDKCQNANNALGKLYNPPSNASFVQVLLDGIPVAYNGSDSSFQYFTAGQTSIGSHKVVVSYTIGSEVLTDSIRYIVTANVTPTISLSTSLYTLCPNQTTTLTANVTNQGTSPTYQWFIDGNNFTTTSNNTLLVTGSTTAGTRTYSVKLTSNAVCATTSNVTSNTVIITIASTLLPTAVISGITTITPGTSTAITIATTNGGATPTYQWQDSTSATGWTNISGVTSSTINYAPSANGVKLRCRLTSNLTCANPTSVNSNTLTFNSTATAINPVAASSYGIKYFPNPVENILTLDSLKLLDKWQTVEIKEISGKQISVQTIANKTTVQLNVASLAKGMYVAILRKKDGLKTYLKFIKN